MSFSAGGEINMSQKNIKLSAVIIAKNEENRIAKCLASVKWADQLVVIDNNSQDKTADISRNIGAEVHVVRIKSFAELRNIGKEKSKYSWILYVDADEIVTEELCNKIKSVIAKFRLGIDPPAYFLIRENYYLGKRWPEQDKMQRLFLKQNLIRWVGDIHETALVNGTFATLKQPLIHDTHRTLEEMVAKTNEWSDTEAQLRLKADHPPVVAWRLFRVMWTGFADSFFNKSGWRAGTLGWIESIYQAFSMFITYAKLWEKQRKLNVHST
jgi:glycosyltransferase involved in cell wall biosynthesis